jgi:hypothetical protein
MLLCGAAALVFSAAVCGGDAGGDDDPRSGPTPSLTPAEVSWDEMVDYIMSCQAVSAFQSHSRYVQLGLRNGAKVWAYEPRLDDMFGVFEDAVAGGCEQIPLATE